METQKGQFQVVFRLGTLLLSLPLERVTRVLRMVALTPVPDASPLLAGVINIAGKVYPVIDLRLRFGLPSRPGQLADRLLVVEMGAQTLVLAVDEVNQVLAVSPEQMEEPSPTLTQSSPVCAILRHDGDLILVLDLDRLLPSVETLGVLDLES